MKKLLELLKYNFFTYWWCVLVHCPKDHIVPWMMHLVGRDQFYYWNGVSYFKSIMFKDKDGRWHDQNNPPELLKIGFGKFYNYYDEGGNDVSFYLIINNERMIIEKEILTPDPNPKAVRIFNKFKVGDYLNWGRYSPELDMMIGIFFYHNKKYRYLHLLGCEWGTLDSDRIKYMRKRLEDFRKEYEQKHKQ